jgi:hypothetical protein
MKSYQKKITRKPEFLGNKAIYNIIGTFIFIIIAVAIAIGLIGYGYFLAGMEEKIDSTVSKEKIVVEAKEKLLYCYAANGVVDRRKLKDACEIPYNYTISVKSYGNCKEGILKQLPSDKSEKTVFPVPILGEDNTSICPGRIEIYT